MIKRAAVAARRPVICAACGRTVHVEVETNRHRDLNDLGVAEIGYVFSATIFGKTCPEAGVA